MQYDEYMLFGALDDASGDIQLATNKYLWKNYCERSQEYGENSLGFESMKDMTDFKNRLCLVVWGGRL